MFFTRMQGIVIFIEENERLILLNMKIIVSLTSWTKRINNVVPVLTTILNQDTKADVIQLNLSLEEFPNKEADLPKDLVEMAKNTQLEIEWVEGNDGVFKKIIPTLKKHYGEEYYLLSIDDDFLYRKDYITMMIKYLKKYNSDTFCLKNARVVGNKMIYKSSVFQPDFWEKLTKEVIDCRIDDSYIEHYLTQKGKKMAFFRPADWADIQKRYNQIFPNSHNNTTGQYSVEDIMKAKNAIAKIKFN